MMVGPHAPLGRILGEKTASKLSRELGVSTAKGLLDHLPRRWVDYGKLSSFADLVEGEHVSFVAEVVSQSERRMQRRRGSSWRSPRPTSRVSTFAWRSSRAIRHGRGSR
ncbi:hypothetical protein [Nesterenkonia pannonica]|uniref:hypothetical protein n=1 Tax=Nesterenkonia pannonica TaxID=1548602 RepID=UPI0021649DC4|nr:hypothetical protein [Nesterenkonia pannonica]